MASHMDVRMTSKSKSWIIDSGCTSHMTFDRSAFSTYKKVTGQSIEMGTGAKAIAAGIEDIVISVFINSAVSGIEIYRAPLAIVRSVYFSLSPKRTDEVFLYNSRTADASSRIGTMPMQQGLFMGLCTYLKSQRKPKTLKFFAYPVFKYEPWGGRRLQDFRGL